MATVSYYNNLISFSYCLSTEYTHSLIPPSATPQNADITGKPDACSEVNYTNIQLLRVNWINPEWIVHV